MIGTLEADGIRYSDIGLDALTIRGDRVRVVTMGDGWEPIEQRFTLRSRRGDTLVVSEASAPRSTRHTFVQLRPVPGAPRPKRIGMSLDGCFGGCPVLDIEVDRSGTVRVHGIANVEREGHGQATAQRALYTRVSGLASALRLDHPHSIGEGLHGPRVTLAVWYGNDVHIFSGTRMEFGPLALLVAELEEAARSVPMVPAPRPYRFESRAAMNWLYAPDFDRRPAPARWVFSPYPVQSWVPPAPVRRPGPSNRVLARPVESLPGFLGDARPR